MPYFSFVISNCKDTDSVATCQLFFRRFPLSGDAAESYIFVTGYEFMESLAGHFVSAAFGNRSRLRLNSHCPDSHIDGLDSRSDRGPDYSE